MQKILNNRELILYGFTPGRLVYSLEYDLVGKIVEFNFPSELVLDGIDGFGEIYCDSNKVCEPSEKDIENMFEITQ